MFVQVYDLLFSVLYKGCLVEVVAHMEVHKLDLVQMNLSPCQYMLWCWLLIAAPLLVCKKCITRSARFATPGVGYGV